jgi:hypothetical protein
LELSAVNGFMEAAKLQQGEAVTHEPVRVGVAVVARSQLGYRQGHDLVVLEGQALRVYLGLPRLQALPL